MTSLDKLTKLYQTGKYAKVIKLGSELCNKNNTYSARIPMLVAESLSKKAEHAKAIPFYQMALAKEATSYSGNLGLGIALFESNNISQAEPYFQKALKSNPKSIPALTWCALLANKLGRPEQAKQYCVTALQIDARCKEAFNLLGLAFLEARDFKKALEALAAAIQIDNKYAAAYKNFAVVLDRTGKPDEALYYADLALKLMPAATEIIYLKATILRSLNKHQQAIALFDNLLEHSPDNCNFHNQKGLTLDELGETKKAIACYDRALEIDKSNANSLANLSQHLSFPADDPRLTLMEELAASPATNAKTRCTLSYALGQQYDKAKNYEIAFSHFDAANKYRFKEFEQYIEYEFTLLQRIKKYFQSANELSRIDLQQASANSFSPIFIVGMPRSGTSLVEQIIASHSSVYGGGELPYLRHSLNIESTLESNIGIEVLAKIRESYAAYLQNLKADQNYITDKMPANFRFIGFILLAFPEAKICHTIRDPMATCWSIYRTNFASEGNVYRYNLDVLGKYYNAYRDLMSFWHKLFPGQIYDLNYEKLTENQEDESRKLIKHLGLEWQDNCLHFDSSDRIVRTASLQQVRQQIYKGSSKAWENYKPFLQQLSDRISAT